MFILFQDPLPYIYTSSSPQWHINDDRTIEERFILRIRNYYIPTLIVQASGKRSVQTRIYYFYAIVNLTLLHHIALYKAGSIDALIALQHEIRLHCTLQTIRDSIAQNSGLER